MLTSIPRFSALVFSNFIMRIIALFIFASATLLSAKAIAKESLHFQKGDIVAIYGNGLADRMQHAPWVETLLQNQLQGMEVRFRNMSFSGDTVDRKPRSKGFIDDEGISSARGPISHILYVWVQRIIQR